MTKLKRKPKSLRPYEILKKELSDLLRMSECEESLPDDIPYKWEKHGDLVVLPVFSFRHSLWIQYEHKLWDIVATSLQCKRIARKNRIRSDNFRSPQVEILRGFDGWVVHTDNKIKYAFDVTKCMFSAGNISEKLRIAEFDCKGETVVDLYAGIGYFTLPYLVHTEATFVHACEWNPHAVEALVKSLTLNKVKHKCSIYFGDNAEVCPEKVADRVNLGLVPSSERGWSSACRALKPSGGIMHVHGNVTSNLCIHLTDQENKLKVANSKAKPEWISWSLYACGKMATILTELYGKKWNVDCFNIIRIKSYAPHIDHVVADLKCTPQKNS